MSSSCYFSLLWAAGAGALLLVFVAPFLDLPTAAVFKYAVDTTMDLLRRIATLLRNPPNQKLEATAKPNKASKRLNLKPRQSYDAFLVLDVEATCNGGTNFGWPNEIIEWPICLLKWTNKDSSPALEIVAEYRSFVRPTWQPQLSEFCRNLTGITQNQVDRAPRFPEVVRATEAFLVSHGLVDGQTGKRLARFCWCSDGPYDIRDFVVKQAFISNIEPPIWLSGDVLDVRKEAVRALRNGKSKLTHRFSPNIHDQLRLLDLPPFIGRHHSGIDDARNISRVLMELARRKISLIPNTSIRFDRRWPWMGKQGQVVESLIVP